MKSIIICTEADKRFIGEAKKMGGRVYVPKTEAALALIRALQAAIRRDESSMVH